MEEQALLNEVQEQVRALGPWHFDIEIANGVRTKDFNRAAYGNVDLDKVGVIDPLEMKELLQLILPGGIVGKRFLDVGCNAGGYCFVAHELGASECFGFDIREHWINQAQFIKSLKYSGVDTIQFRVADVKTFTHRHNYDVTLFKGIFYHIPDPISTLRSICDLTDRAIIIDTASRSDIPGECMSPWRESTTHVMSGVDGLAWFPGGPEVIQPILTWAGFTHMRVVQHKKGDASERFRGRFRVIATRKESDLSAYDAAKT